MSLFSLVAIIFIAALCLGSLAHLGPLAYLIAYFVARYVIKHAKRDTQDGDNNEPPRRDKPHRHSKRERAHIESERNQFYVSPNCGEYGYKYQDMLGDGFEDGPMGEGFEE